MKTKLIALLILVSINSFAQDLTTFVLVRHAEKAAEGGNDPALTSVGQERSQQILSLFNNADVSAIYSTNFKRTRDTVAPLATAKGLEINLYDWKDPKALLESILEKNKGGIVIISGHSNTTPTLANILLGSEQLEKFDESDYSNLLIVTTSAVGKGRLLHLSY